MKKIISSIEVDSINKDEKYFIDVFCLGHTNINFDEQWEVSDSHNINALLGCDGVFYQSKIEDVEEVMEELSTSREDVLNSFTYMLNNDLKSQTYQIFFDRIRKDGVSTFNQKYENTFDWSGDNGESLEKTALDFFVL